MHTQGDKVSFLLLHGLLCDGDTWAHLIGPLSRLGPVTVAQLTGIDSLPQAATDALASIPGPLVVIGHSMGGRVALEIARQAPKRCAGLVLMNTGYKPLAEGETERRMALVDAARSGGIAAIVAPWLDTLIAPATVQNTRLMDAMRTMVLRSSPESFAGQIHALIHRPDATDVLGQTRCPTLLLSGSEDSWSPLSRHHEMAALMPGNPEVEAIPRAGHMAPFEEPEACTAAILAWLARHDLAHPPMVPGEPGAA
ncbi:MAG: alpha/beta hydrolase [Alcaligenaceae bacterium]|nr:alpha/beta hydrolase [Alcaligenaceae bacterium]